MGDKDIYLCDLDEDMVEYIYEKTTYDIERETIEEILRLKKEYDEL